MLRLIEPIILMIGLYATIIFIAKIGGKFINPLITEKNKKYVYIVLGILIGIIISINVYCVIQ